MFDTTITTSPTAGFGMSMSLRDRVASVRALPMTTGVVSLQAGAIVPATGIQGTAVCGYRHATDVVVAVTGAFPGTSAWSPPI